MILEPVLVPEDLSDLRTAKTLLEYPGFASRAADLIGKPVEFGLSLLPLNWNEKIGGLVNAALLKSLELALMTMGKKQPVRARNALHKLLVAGTGVAGGAFGFTSLAVELPLSTTIMLRSIADIARDEGHDLALLETRLACLEVFALGGETAKDDAAETGYWMTRAAITSSLKEAAAYIARYGLGREGAPPVVAFVAKVAARFSVTVTEEAAAKAVPVVGGLTGGLINLMFMDHFQKMARGHFIVRRLELKYGSERVQAAYRALSI